MSWFQTPGWASWSTLIENGLLRHVNILSRFLIILCQCTQGCLPFESHNSLFAAEIVFKQQTETSDSTEGQIRMKTVLWITRFLYVPCKHHIPVIKPILKPGMQTYSVKHTHVQCKLRFIRNYSSFFTTATHLNLRVNALLWLHGLSNTMCWSVTDGVIVSIQPADSDNPFLPLHYTCHI